MMIVQDEEIKTKYKTKLKKSEIIIGGEINKFVPNINFNRWSDEAWFNINHKETIISNEKENFNNDKIEIKANSFLHRFYELENKKLEYEIEVEENFDKNFIEFDIDFSDNLQFYFQKSSYDEWNDSAELKILHPTFEDFQIYNDRSEEVENSYAVYIAKKNNQYTTGKFVHIYRPKIYNKKDEFIYGNILIDEKNKKLIVSWDSKFKAVIIDPTFGYDTVGASSYGNSGAKMGSSSQMGGVEGTSVKYHLAVASVDGGDNNIKVSLNETTEIYGASYPHNPRNQALIEYVAGTVAVSDDEEITADGSTLPADGWIWIGFIPSNSNTKIKYDSGSGYNSSYYISGTTFAGEFTNPWNAGESHVQWWISEWMEYTTGGEIQDAPFFGCNF